MEAFWFWLIIILLLIAVLALPSWPYTRERWPYTTRYRYAPSAIAGLIAFFLIFLFWFGLIALWIPWDAATPGVGVR